jgi:hypothetical protein
MAAARGTAGERDFDDAARNFGSAMTEKRSAATTMQRVIWTARAVRSTRLGRRSVGVKTPCGGSQVGAREPAGALPVLVRMKSVCGLMVTGPPEEGA